MTREMKEAGMFWKNGKKHWKLMHEGELITVWPHGYADSKDCNGTWTKIVIERRLRQWRENQ